VKLNLEKLTSKVPDMEVISIYPVFFELDDGPTQADCPRLYSDTLYPNHVNMVDNKHAAMIYEPAHN